MRQEVAGRSPIAVAAGLLVALAIVVLVVLLADLRAEDSARAENPDAEEHHFNFFNDTGVTASDLHIEFNVPVKKPIVDVIGSDCPPVEAFAEGPFVQIDWGIKCVESDGLTTVSVTVFSKEPQESIAVISSYWTNDGEPIGTVTPFATVTATDVPLETSPPSTATDVPPPGTIPIGTPVPPVDTATPTSGPPPIVPTATNTFTPTPTQATSTPTATATSTSAPVTTPTPTVGLGSGDVNCSGIVDSIDALLILQLIAQLVQSLPCSFAADVNQNTAVNSIDVALLLQFVANLIPSVPVPAIPSP